MVPSTGPSHIGRYAIRRRIGSGGFATVWLGYDEQLDAPVAIKVLADNWSEQHEVRTRFVEEGRFLRRVESPHVVPVYDAGALDDGRPYLVMAFADQGTLSERLAGGGVTVPQALEVVTQIGAGLQALHDRGVLHRDVKPANVLFRTVDPAAGVDGVRAMVGDLGLGKALDVSSRLTMIAGTPAYVAPEQAQGESPDPRADQFSLGVLTFLLLSGRLPWSHASLAAAAHGVAAAPLSERGRAFPSAVEDVVRRALAHDRGARWPSVTAYVGALTHALDGWAGGPSGPGTRVLPVDPALTLPGARPSPVPDHAPLPDPVPPPRPSRAAHAVRGVGVGALLLAVLGAGAAAGYLGERETEAEPVPQPAMVEDTTGTLGVTVPASWTADATGEWNPPNAQDKEFAALSVGTSSSWPDEAEGEGVFAAMLPGTELPDPVPQHPECTTAGDPLETEFANDPSVTAVFSDCEGGGIVVERVVQVAAGQLLWVQVRSPDRATANEILDSVEVSGL